MIRKLALEYGVKINEDIFHSIPILGINTVVVRMIGFGESIIAFPYLSLFAKWFDAYLNQKKGISTIISYL